MKKILFTLIGLATITLGSCGKSDSSVADDKTDRTETTASVDANADVPADIAALSEKLKGNTEEILPDISQKEYAAILDHMMSEAKYYYSLPEDKMVKFMLTPRGDIWTRFQICIAMAHLSYLDEANEQKYADYNEYVESQLSAMNE